MAPESVWRRRNMVRSGEGERTLDRRPLNPRFTWTWAWCPVTGKNLHRAQRAVPARKTGGPTPPVLLSSRGTEEGYRGSPQPWRGGTNGQVRAGGVPKLGHSREHLIRKNLSKAGCKRPAAPAHPWHSNTPTGRPQPPPPPQCPTPEEPSPRKEKRRKKYLQTTRAHAHTHTHARTHAHTHAHTHSKELRRRIHFEPNLRFTSF